MSDEKEENVCADCGDTCDLMEVGDEILCGQCWAERDMSEWDDAGTI